MAGLVPAIHDFLLAAKTWMPGSSPGMTRIYTNSDTSPSGSPNSNVFSVSDTSV